MVSEPRHHVLGFFVFGPSPDARETIAVSFVPRSTWRTDQRDAVLHIRCRQIGRGSRRGAGRSWFMVLIPKRSAMPSLPFLPDGRLALRS